MKRSDAAALFFFSLLVLIFFAPVLLGGATLLPFDNLYRFPPWQSFAASFGVTQPHNPLLDDLVLENYPWKKFIIDSLQQGQVPLWNPYILAGQPFLAAGQNAALYPLGILFYLLPLTSAYGVFVALHFWLAAAAMYLFGRVLGLRPFSATVGATVYAFSAFMVVSVVFPMVISAAAWLPAILALVDLMLREQSGRNWSRRLFFALVASVLVGMQFLAGHVESSYYILIVIAFYGVWRMVEYTRDSGRPRERALALVKAAFALGAVLALGFGVAAVQLVPLYELVQRNFRAGSVSYSQVAGWALPIRQLVTFVIPDFFGNPSHHSYLDVVDWTVKSAPAGTIFWGVKNYVEAGSYVGLLPLALAAISVLYALRSFLRRSSQASSVSSSIYLFACLAALSLLFAFGTPLYALLFYGLPGYNQLHTAFRWIFPYTLSVAFLAAAGVEVLLRELALFHAKNWRWAFRMISGLGLAVLAALALCLAWPAPILIVSSRLIDHSDLARPVFETGQAFWSYEFRNFLLFGVFLLGAGTVLELYGRQIHIPRRLGSSALWQPLALVIIVGDLFSIGVGFNPAANPHLADFTPPAIQFLEQDHSLYRIATFDLPGTTAGNAATGAAQDRPPERILNPNAGMYFGISDIRGYDSIIPKQYAEFMSALAPQDELLYNRIAPFYDYRPLSSPLLNLLNVKYVLSTRAVPNPGYRLVYDGEIKVYENASAMPRAFLVGAAKVIPDRAELLMTLPTIDPSAEVLFEQEPPPLAAGSTPIASSLPVPSIESYGGNEVIVKSNALQSAYLVLADSYFPGWIAQLDGNDTPLYRVDGNFRGVFVPAGEHVVRFKYSPLSFKVGAVTSLVAALVVLLGLAGLAWRRFALPETSPQGAQVQLVAKNSLVPMSASFLTKGLNFAFALVMLRVLGPENVGRYSFAVAVWFFFNSITDFGLGILMTREVARDRGLANRYVSSTAVLRMLLTAVSLGPLALLIWGYATFSNLTFDTTLAILLLWASLIPANLAASFSYLFNAYERFEYPTAVQVATQLLSVTLQLAALLAGWGIVGLAAVSIVSNLFTLVVLYFLVRTTLFHPRWEFDSALLRWMFFESYPLMLNNLLANLFFRIDVFLLKLLTNDAVLGYYSTAYKFIDALNFIPSNFTLAIFPLLSRYAAAARDSMYRALVISLKLLLWIAVPITVASFFIARELILLFGGSAYLPDSAIALQWLIWFLPFSFVNSVVHYVLIALQQQRFLTKAFLIGFAFNVIVNVIAIPQLSYRGAALVTVLSEIALLIPFYYSLRRRLAPLPVVSLIWRPVFAGTVMGGALFLLLPRVSLVLALAASSLLYVTVLLLSGAMGPDERTLLRRLLPSRLERMVAALARS